MKIHNWLSYEVTYPHPHAVRYYGGYGGPPRTFCRAMLMDIGGGRRA